MVGQNAMLNSRNWCLSSLVLLQPRIPRWCRQPKPSIPLSKILFSLDFWSLELWLTMKPWTFHLKCQGAVWFSSRQSLYFWGKQKEQVAHFGAVPFILGFLPLMFWLLCSCWLPPNSRVLYLGFIGFLNRGIIWGSLFCCGQHWNLLVKVL